MAIFKGQKTEDLQTKDARCAGPDIVLTKHLYTREKLEWADPHPDDPRKQSFRLYVRKNRDNTYTVMASMGVNQSMKKDFPTLDEAAQVYHRTNHWVTVKTLYNQGFRQW